MTPLSILVFCLTVANMPFLSCGSHILNMTFTPYPDAPRTRDYILEEVKLLTRHTILDTYDDEALTQQMPKPTIPSRCNPEYAGLKKMTMGVNPWVSGDKPYRAFFKLSCWKSLAEEEFVNEIDVVNHYSNTCSENWNISESRTLDTDEISVGLNVPLFSIYSKETVHADISRGIETKVKSCSVVYYKAVMNVHSLKSRLHPAFIKDFLNLPQKFTNLDAYNTFWSVWGIGFINNGVGGGASFQLDYYSNSVTSNGRFSSASAGASSQQGSAELGSSSSHSRSIETTRREAKFFRYGSSVELASDKDKDIQFAQLIGVDFRSYSILFLGYPDIIKAYEQALYKSILLSTIDNFYLELKYSKRCYIHDVLMRYKLHYNISFNNFVKIRSAVRQINNFETNNTFHLLLIEARICPSVKPKYIPSRMTVTFNDTLSVLDGICLMLPVSWDCAYVSSTVGNPCIVLYSNSHCLGSGRKFLIKSFLTYMPQFPQGSLSYRNC